MRTLLVIKLLLVGPQGGFSEIWLAEHRTSHELVAIKVVQLVEAELEPDEVRVGKLGVQPEEVRVG